MDKLAYEVPEMDIVKLEQQDVITNSGDTDIDNPFGE